MVLHRLTALALMPLVAWLLAACATAPTSGSASPPASDLSDFTTDGCSMYPDRSTSTGKDWCSCCVAHDRAYWRGGSEADRLKADEELRRCVEDKTGDASRAALMFRGVRLGGGAHLPTPFRWGYGWPYGRGYQTLSAEESAQADRLLARYDATMGPDHCPSAPSAASSPLSRSVPPPASTAPAR